MSYQKFEDTPLAQLIKKLKEMPPVGEVDPYPPGQSPDEIEPPPVEVAHLPIETPRAHRLAVFRHEGHIVLEPREGYISFSTTIMDMSEALHLAQAILEVETAIREGRVVSEKYEDGFLMVMNNVDQEVKP